MEFMSLVNEHECVFDNYAKTYCGQPLVVYGCGYKAACIIQGLHNYEIKNFKVCVDKKYFKTGQVVDGYEVCELETILSDERKKYDIIVAFEGYKPNLLSKRIQENNWSVNQVLWADIASHFWMKPQIFSVARSFYEKFDSELSVFYESLHDELSKRNLISFINQRISGDYNYSKNVISDSTDEYFPKELLEDQKNLILVDCGAFDGNDTKRFFDIYNGYSFVVEPDKKNNILVENNLRNLDNVTIVNKATSNRDDEILSFAEGGNMGSGIVDESDVKVSTVTIDSLWKKNLDKFVEKKTVLKMDIEGMELKTLQGAKDFIKLNRPILSICVYHKPEDIVEIPKFIMNINPSYKLFLRRYDSGFRDTVLYAI